MELRNFYPPYLFTKDWNNKTVLAKRPKILNLKNTIKRGEINLQIDNGFLEDIDSFTIISTGATTHAQGSEPKFRSLDFNKLSSNKYKLKIPLNNNELANGTYMIFAISKKWSPQKEK